MGCGAVVLRSERWRATSRRRGPCASQRHIKLLLLEQEVEEILAQVKYTVRQGLGTAITTQLRSQFFGGPPAAKLQAHASSSASHPASAGLPTAIPCAG